MYANHSLPPAMNVLYVYNSDVLNYSTKWKHMIYIHSGMSVVSNECNEPTSCLVQPIGAHCSEVMYFGCFGFRGELGFLNCDDGFMCVVNKQSELLFFYIFRLC